MIACAILISKKELPGSIRGIWLFYSRSNPELHQVFPATINRDCAPWDGPALTISFPYDAVTSITISIWPAPSFAFPATFSFPDETMRTGMVYVQREHDPMEVLSGKVWLRRLEEGKSVEGRLSFSSERGEHFNGIFFAQWEIWLSIADEGHNYGSIALTSCKIRPYNNCLYPSLIL